MSRGRLLAPLAAIALVATPSLAQIRLSTTRVASGLSKPLFVTAPPGDTSRLFIVEQGTNGTAEIKILDLESGTILPRSFLSIPGISDQGERGLLGLAFHPDYARNGLFYVYVSDTDASETVRSYKVSVLPNVADPASMKVVYSMFDNFPGHNGGWIGFGPDDGYLYIGTGDGMDPQNPQNYFGKILRIDVDGDDFPADPSRNFAVPPSNPFAGVAGEEEVFDIGLRNPWRDSFDRETGDLYIGDVGWIHYEEVDVSPAGQSAVNFGWECMEGPMCSGNGTCTCNAPSLSDPIVSYDHGSGCAIVGGYVYRGNALCGLQGTYFYADYCTARIWSLRWANGVATELRERTAELAPAAPLSIGLISSFGEDASGELYICDHADGEIYRIVAGAMEDCNHNGTEDACDIESGASADADRDGVPDECESSATAFCFGDGSDGACPCRNLGASGRGCQNSAGTGGAAIAASGSASVARDTLVLTTTGELPSVSSVCMQGDLEIAPTRFGEGERCASGVLKRLYVKSASGGAVTVPGAGDPSVTARSAALGSVIAPGSVRVYQTYYRDPASTFCPAPPGFNVSSAMRVQWGP